MKARAIRLPEDTQPHDAVIEWWYFNGHLADAKGGRYSFMDCLFRANLNKAEIPYLKNFLEKVKKTRYAIFAHSVLADIERKKSFKDVQNISLASRDSFTKPLFYARYVDPVAPAKGPYEIAETKPGHFRVKTDRLDLVMESRKQPMLEGGRGSITVRSRESFYYSLTELRTTGTIRAGSKWSASGRSWMDHQWADSPYTKDKWAWFSIQLEDGTDIMCVEYDDGMGKDYVVSVLDARGKAVHYGQAAFEAGERTWKSKITDVHYPLSWTITIPEKAIVLKTSALLPDGEMIFGAINYWEGPIAVTGVMGKKKSEGRWLYGARRISVALQYSIAGQAHFYVKNSATHIVYSLARGSG